MLGRRGDLAGRSEFLQVLALKINVVRFLLIS